MQVKDGLTCGLAIVDADVVSGRLMLDVETSLCSIQQRQHFRTPVGARLEERANVPPRNDQGMARRNWKRVADGQGKGGLIDDALS